MRIATSSYIAAIMAALSACDDGSSLQTVHQPSVVIPASGQEVELTISQEQASFCAQPTEPGPKAVAAGYTDGVCPGPKGDPVNIFVWAAPQLTSINLSETSLILDRWGDSATINARPVDQHGNDLSSATIV